jgi:hypothetical protein
MKSLCVILAILLTASVSVAQSKISLNFGKVEQMGFISLYNNYTTPNLAGWVGKKVIVTAELDGTQASDTTDIESLAIDKTKNEIGCSIYAPDMVIKYFDQTGTKYQLPLGPTDLEKFGKKAKWTARLL